MTEAMFNPNDPAFLASRSFDEELTPEEKTRLGEALHTSSELRKELEAFKQLDALLRNWRLIELPGNESGFTASVMESIEALDNPETETQVDHLLSNWRTLDHAINEKAFVHSVMREVQPKRLRLSPRRRVVYRLMAPLALAASVALMITVFQAWQPRESPRMAVQFDRSRQTASVVVRQSPIETQPQVAVRSNHVAMISMSSIPRGDAEEAPPL